MSTRWCIRARGTCRLGGRLGAGVGGGHRRRIRHCCRRCFGHCRCIGSSSGVSGSFGGGIGLIQPRHYNFGNGEWMPLGFELDA